jgi:predicted small lipoprotein YifL
MKRIESIVMLCASSILLSACGQTGPLYMPGTASGIHKKDEFILGNKPHSDTTVTPAATNNAKTTETNTTTSNVNTTETDATVDSAKTTETDVTTNSNKNSSQ